MIEYSDFQCPYCGKFSREVLPALEKTYIDTGKVVLAFRQLPLEKLHPYALKAAQAASCAREQNRFWEAHDQLFGNQNHLDDASLRDYSKTLNLDGEMFSRCLGGPVLDNIREDMAQAQALSIGATPTILVGLLQPDGLVKVTKRLDGAPALVDFRTLLDALLSDNAAARKQ